MGEILLTLTKKIDSYKVLALLLSCSFMSSYSIFMFNQANIPTAQAHLEHLPHYNSGGSRYGYGDYMSFMALEPEYGTTDYPTQITFSIQDFDNNDVYNVSTMVEMYESASGRRTHVFPWTPRDIGDFHLYYQFPKKGTYQIVQNKIKDKIDLITAGLQPYLNHCLQDENQVSRANALTIYNYIMAMKTEINLSEVTEGQLYSFSSNYQDFFKTSHF